MADQLTRLVPRDGKSHQENDVVQSLFQEKQEIFPRDSLFLVGNLKVSPELFFQDPVNTPRFLFFPELNGVIREFSSPPSMLSRRIGSPFKRAFICKTSIPFEEQLRIFPSAKPAR